MTPTPARRPWWSRHRERLTDTVLSGVLVLATVSLLLGAAPPAQMWRYALLTAAVAVAMWWRRRFPLGVAVGAVVAVALGASEFSVAAALFTLAIRRRDRVLALVAAASTAALTVAWVQVMRPPGVVSGLVGMTVTLGIFVGLPLAVGAYVGIRRDLVASLRERAERAEAEQQLRGEQARLSERSRIAREMHDVLAHRISLVALHAGGLEVNPSSPPEQVERTAGLIGDHARRALDDLRGVLGVLRADAGEDRADGADLIPQPTLSGVPRLVEASRQAGVPATLDVDLSAEPPDLVGRTVYRVVQEGLTNVHKHALGATVAVRVHGSPGEKLVVELRNARAVGSELGGRPVGGAGVGLLGLRERVHLIGGTFEAGEDVHGGFAVRACLPWPA
ncbi:sensor histidine kinase [Pseudonocardia bannensis]|uniref:histidine kinase n=1 Tax=Pseudonocardia bannensis TaxID=630973 RepID=A0A848DDV1_9PSEU|nr:histidine kinase [Pseudonocardia bannensis]NMH90779.1 two-component sensor histidine kinase [Pseudonocardia bannensis]